VRERSQMRPGLRASGRSDTPRLCRRKPSFLNRGVQVGTVALASGFPLGDGLAQQPHGHVPRVRIRLKKIPRPRSITTGGVWEMRLYPFGRRVQMRLGGNGLRHPLLQTAQAPYGVRVLAPPGFLELNQLMSDV
jgi:hypothetical protein